MAFGVGFSTSSLHWVAQNKVLTRTDSYAGRVLCTPILRTSIYARRFLWAPRHASSDMSRIFRHESDIRRTRQGVSLLARAWRLLLWFPFVRLGCERAA